MQAMEPEYIFSFDNSKHCFYNYQRKKMKSNIKHKKASRFEKIINRVFDVSACLSILSIGLWFLFLQPIFLGLFLLLISIALLNCFILMINNTMRYFKYIRQRKQSWHYFISALFVLFFCMIFTLASLLCGLAGIVVLYQAVIKCFE